MFILRLMTFCYIYIITGCLSSQVDVIVCEENDVCLITHRWKNLPDKNITLTWQKDGVPVCNCSLAGNCKSSPQHKNWIISYYQPENEFSNITLNFLPNTLETDIIQWHLLAYSSNKTTLLNSWKSRFYRKIENYHCSIGETHPLKLTCAVFESYPISRCIFTDILTEQDQREYPVIHHNITVPDQPHEVTSYCSIVLPSAKKEMFAFEVIIYPDLTSNSTYDLKYGITHNISLKIEQPKVNHDCYTDFNEGEKISCACFKSDLSNLTTEVLWYNNVSETPLAIGKDKALLDLIADVNMTGFVCVGSNALSMESEKIYYEITVRGKVDFNNFRCPDLRQHKCGSHGLCFFNYEFCTKDKKVESCFPLNITDLLEWCREIGQFNTSLMRDKHCGHACVSRFGRELLSNVDYEEENPENITCRCHSNSNTPNYFIAFICTASILLVVIILIPILYMKRECFRQKQHDNKTKKESTRMSPFLKKQHDNKTKKESTRMSPFLKKQHDNKTKKESTRMSPFLKKQHDNKTKKESTRMSPFLKKQHDNKTKKKSTRMSPFLKEEISLQPKTEVYASSQMQETHQPDHCVNTLSLSPKDVNIRRPTSIIDAEMHEAEMCFEEETDLHKHVTGCKKNPGHKGFIPVNDFNINYLPSRYHDDLVFETIKTLAALTVQVKTKFTSLERPEFYPGTQVPYPCYNDRGRHVMRLGTGRVYCVDKYTESDRKACRCAKCKVSATPSKVWGEVRVLTATHVVFDDSEARQTRCVVGFDDNKSPGVSLDGWEMGGRADIEGDWCWFTCVTCELELVDELDKMCDRFNGLCLKLMDKYRRFVDVDKLTAIVSHPHGCPKHISVGNWTHTHESDGLTRYFYTTCTCPGSAGAPVFMPGVDSSWLFPPPHSGTNSEGNYSVKCFELL